MEPLSEERKREILRDNPLATPDAIEEYERLLAEEFEVDPDQLKNQELRAEQIGREQRIEELYRLLFPESRR